MSENIHDQLRELLLISSAFNTNDILVHCIADGRRVIKYEGVNHVASSIFPKNILRDAQRSIRETGVNTLSLARGLVILNLNGKEVSSPIYLTPVLFKINKLKAVIELEPQEDDSFLNPFLQRYLEREHSIKLTFDNVVEELKVNSLDVSMDEAFLANFHHHRFEIVREIEEIIDQQVLSSSLRTIFGEIEHSSKSLSFKLPKASLFPSDLDQEGVYRLAEKSNLVIQGPPGTGKSHVLSNLCAKFLYNELCFVVVSEKHVALDVIQKKLGEFGLDHLTYVASANNLNSDFITKLKHCWEYFEEYEGAHINNLMLSEQYEAHLQMTLDLLKVPDLVGGISFHEFNSLLENSNFKGVKYSSEVPLLSEVINHEETIKFLYQTDLSNSVSIFKKATLNLDNFSQFDVVLENLIRDIRELQHHFPITTWRDLQDLMKKSSRSQIIENELFKKYSKIFKPNSKEQNLFLKHYKKYHTLQKKRTQFDNITHWKSLPSLIETKELISALNSRGLFERLRIKKRWKQLSYLQLENAPIALEEHLQRLQIYESISQIEVKFCELGIEDTEREVDLIYHSFKQFTDEEWSIVFSTPLSNQLKLTDFHRSIHSIYNQLRDFFQVNDGDHLLEKLTLLRNQFGELLPVHHKLRSLSSNALKCFQVSPSYEHYFASIILSHYTKFKEQFPALSNFKPATLVQQVNDVIASQNIEAELFSKEILNRQKATLERYHELLNTPARKLTDVDKEFKLTLRKGKSILVKEFGKTRSFMSPRELYESEAQIWLRTLCPIWLSNPSQLANSFPMKEIFDVVIFDEASQIPLQNGLGAIQRSKRIIIAGDEQQMGPSSYFQTLNSEQTDLLHQAAYYYNKTSLKQHYRSEHPDLISFSNKYFYKNELNVYPAYNREMNPIVLHYVPDGVFEDRKNEKEAQKIANRIQEQIGGPYSLGIVAFSEEQLQEIWRCLDEKTKITLEEQVSVGNAFFKALENVQGDECDILLISFAYGNNAQGDFHMRFGPMNTSNGRKRLNVLLTRAIKRIEFFCSVRSSNFKLSDNESVELLRQWFSFCENYDPNHTLQFPYNLNPTIEGQKLTFHRIQDSLGQARELVTLQRALENRKWLAQYL